MKGQTQLIRTGWVAAALAVGLAGAARAAEATAPEPAPQESRFSIYIDDLPIMPGLDETEDGYAFDIYQGGRMAEAQLAGKEDAKAVRSFYAATLPQLGWTPVGQDPTVYRRGRERLMFRIEQKRGGKAAELTATFVLTPETAQPEGR
jgi:hypothetical protein